MKTIELKIDCTDTNCDNCSDIKWDGDTCFECIIFAIPLEGNSYETLKRCSDCIKAEVKTI